MVIRFAGSLNPMFTELRAALEAKDQEVARRHAHSISGAAGNLSADGLRRLAKTLELAIKFEQGDVSRMLEELEREAARIMEGVRQLRESRPAVTSSADEEPAATTTSLPERDARRLRTMLEELAAALEEGDYDGIGTAAGKLKSASVPAGMRTDYERLTDLVDAFEYVEAAGLVRIMQERLPVE
jgi:HPt (histidine-containing phosphotransfer) domain-containing protein